MIDVVYQYVDGKSADEELKNSIRSIERYLDAQFKLHIVGDMPSNLELEHVNHIPLERKDGVEFTNCYDAGAKMNAVILHPEIGENILYMYDDIYLMQKVTVEELRELTETFCMQESDADPLPQDTKHRQLVNRTREVLQKAGKPSCNAETHMPRLISKSKMIEVFQTYTPIRNRLLMFTLYFNHFLQGDFKTINEIQPKIGCYGYDDQPLSYAPKSATDLRDLLKKAIVLNHNDQGYSSVVKEVLDTRFKTKSKFEV